MAVKIEEPFYEVQRIELTLPAASEAIARVIIDSDYAGGSVVDLTNKITSALGFKNKFDDAFKP